uniref:Lipoprotein n=1 Tax=Tenacibaculum sp. Pbs-1 TaxID=3238748 RepID=A0AB33L156_9FLAO
MKTMSKYKFITLFIVILHFFINCKLGGGTNLKSPDNINVIIENDSIINIDRKKVSEECIKKAERIRMSENLEPNEGRDLEKGHQTIFVEVLEEMETGDKNIEYTINSDNKDIRESNSYSFYLDTLDNAFLIINTITNYNIEDESEVTLVKDTIFLKENKIIFIKDRHLSKDELLVKQEEIDVIKREINKILKN